MSLSLAHLPQEALSIIASYLSDVEVTSTLHLCGNNVLSRKISQATLSLRYTSRRLPAGRLKIISTFSSLLELIVDLPSNADGLPLRSLVDAMPQRLRKLSICHANGMELSYQRLTLNESLDPNFFPFRTLDYRATIMSERFPQLEYLSLTGSLGSSWHGIMIRFLCGLPRTLTYLNIPQFEIPISIWTILPPELISIPFKVPIPTKDEGGIPSALMTSLRELNVNLFDTNLSRSMKLRFSGKPALDGTIRHFQPRFAHIPSELILPSQLTRLTLSSSLPEGTPYFLPNTLQWLDWRGLESRILDLNAIMAFVPPSVTHLSLGHWMLQPSTAESIPIQPRPHTRSLEFDCNNQLIYLDLISAFPNLESLRNLSSMSLQKIHVDALNPRTLTSLECSIDLAVLNATSSPDSKPLASEDAEATDSQFAKQFPNLKVLKLLTSDGFYGYSPNGFSFACVPPSVTHLRVESNTTATTLHLLPASVIKLELNRTIAITKKLTQEHLHQLFFPVKESSEYDLQTLRLGWTAFQRQAPKSRNQVEGTSRPSASPAWFSKDRSFSLRFALEPKVSIALPPTLTYLELESNLVLSPAHFNPTVLPCLRKLSVHGLDGHSLGGFTALTSLRFQSLRNAKPGVFPPNLTRLKALNSLRLLPSDDPSVSILPLSLQKLTICRFESYDRLCLLTNLTSLSFYAVLSAKDLEQLRIMPLPPSITELLNCNTTAESSIALLSALPNVLALHAPALDLNYSELEEIYTKLAPSGRLIGGALKTIEDPLRLLLSIQTKPGSLIPTSQLEKHIFDLVKERYPNWMGEDQGPTFDCQFNSLAWSSFAKLLSPTITILLIGPQVSVPDDFAKHLPRTIQVLHVATRKKPHSLNCTKDLPPGLLELNIDTTGFGQKTYELLPRTLRTLALNNQSKFSQPFADAIPPQLTSLSISANNVPASVLKSLSPSITKLELQEMSITPGTLAILPPTVIHLETPASASPSSVMIDMAKTRGMVWLSSDAHGNHAPNWMLSQIDALDEHLDRFLQRD